MTTVRRRRRTRRTLPRPRRWIPRALGGAVAAGVVAVGGVVPTAAQNDQPLTVSGVDVDTPPEVSAVVATPPTSSGSRLAPSAFSVTENGEDVPVTVDALDQERLQVVLAVDTSGSMAGAPIAAAREAAGGFVEDLPAGAEIGLVGFDTDLVVSDVATDRAFTNFVIANLEAGGETGLYDALLASTDMFSDDADTARVIVLLSDGGDTVSATSLDDAVARLAEDGISVYSVALLTGETDLPSLQQLSASSGRVVEADDPVALEGIYDQLARELTSPYQLRWETANSGSTSVEFRVDHPDLGPISRTLGLEYGELAAAPPPTAAPTAPPPTEATAQESAPATLTVDAAGDGWKLWVGLGAVAIALLAIGLVMFWPHQRTRRLAKELNAGLAVRQGVVGRTFDRVAEFAAARLRGGDRESGLQQRLDRAGLGLSAGVAVTRGIGFVLVALLIGMAFGSFVAGLLLGAVTALALMGYLVIAADRRQQAFADQLESTLQMMTGSLRAGFGLNQALGTVAQEADSPTREEFTRAISEVRIGRDLTAALHDVADRVQSEDFEWVVQAIEINREVGGNLSEVLENVTATIRQRRNLDRRVRALSAEGRLSAVVLLILPVAMVLWMSVTNPEYIGELTADAAGWVLIAFAGVLMVVGTFWMRKIIRIRY